MRSIGRALTAMAGTLALTAMGALVAVQPASAKDGPLSIQSVWVGDIHQAHRTVLNSGDAATYHVDVDNTTGKAMQVEIEFEVLSADWASNYSYNYTAHKVYMPAGVRRFYSPSTIPVNAYTGDYIARISIWPTSSANPSNDGDWGEAYFHVFSLSASPVNTAIGYLQNTALCVGTIASYLFGEGEGSILLESVKTGVEALGYFKDPETGNVYWANVKYLKELGATCVSAVTGAGAGARALFHVYTAVKT